MPSRLSPYIHFNGSAKDAMEFYKSIFGGKLDISTFKDSGMPVDPTDESKIMHAMLEGDNGIVFMASDTPKHMEYTPGTTVTMSLSGDDEALLKGYWDGLSNGGTIQQPLVKAPWGDTFGMLKDKFDIEWMVNIVAPKA
jgi:PhnB protein